MAQTRWFGVLLVAALLVPQAAATQGPPKILFDHTHTSGETAAYLNAVAKAYPDITRLHSIGKSFLGKDFLVLEIFPSNGREIDRLRWSDENYGGKLFLPWKPFDHPQVEIGGFVNKVYDARYKTYTNTMMLPGPQFERLLANHTKWHLFLIQQSPLVRISNVSVTGGEDGYFTVTADVTNEGALPTNVTEQALQVEITRPVMARASVTGGTLVSQPATIALGHLSAKGSGARSSGRASWVVRAGAGSPSVTIEAISEKGGTHTRTVPLKSGVS